MTKTIIAILLLLPPLAHGQTWQRVAYDDAGNPATQPHLANSAGCWRFENPGTDDEVLRTCAFGERVEFAYAGLKAGANFRARLRFFSDKPRGMRIKAGNVTLVEALALETGKPLEKNVELPKAAYETGQLLLALERTDGPNAVVSEIEIYSDDPAGITAISEPPMEVPVLTPRPSTVNGCANVSLDLGGVWKFNAAPAADFARSENLAGWKDIQVPGEWVMQGFDVKPGTAAGYFRMFTVPADWQGKRIILQCDAVHSDVTVSVNGKEVGKHIGCFLPFQFDITPMVKPGTNNTLALAIKNESIADTLAKGSSYAKHPLGGISRRIHMFPVPEPRLAKFQIDTTLDAGLRDGTLELDTAVAGGDPELLVSLKSEPAGQTVLSDVRITPGKVSIPVANSLKWHAESPNYYTATIKVVVGGTIVETVTKQCGFRKIEVVDRQVQINGKPVKLKGVCRHSVHPLTGRSLTLDIIRKDAEMFKDANCNFIRTSHYPPEEEFLDECDRLGLFVMDEGPFCWMQESDSNNPHNSAFIRRTLLELQARDRHHPSVIVWSMANESFWSDSLEKTARALKENDPSRLIFFSHSEYYGVKGEGLLDFGTRHYPNWYTVKNFATYLRPVLFDEFCHVNAYNGGEIATDPGIRDRWGDLFHQMWDDIAATRILPGVAIWGGIDEVFITPAGGATGYGPWGIMDGWRRPKPEYWSVKKTFSPVRVDDRPRQLTDGKIILPVENRFDTAAFDTLSFRWKFGSHAGTVESSLPAGKLGSLVVALPANAPATGELELSVFDRRNVLVDRYLIPVNPAEQKAAVPARVPVHFAESKKEWKITCISCDVIVNRKTGLFSVATRAGKPLIVQAPFLMMPSSGKSNIKIVNGIPVDERGEERDDGLFFSPVSGQWTPGDVRLVGQSDTRVEIRVAGKYEQAEGWFNYTITDGGCEVVYVFKHNGGSGLRQTGIVLNLPTASQNLSWKRKGYWSWYPEDQIGRTEGRCTAFPHPPVPDYNGPRQLPDYPWTQDTLSPGANDFRSTKHNIYFAELTDPSGAGIRIDSDTTEHVRCWMENDGARMLIANHSNQGSEQYFRMVADREARNYENPDDRLISDTVRIHFLSPKEK